MSTFIACTPERCINTVCATYANSATIVYEAAPTTLTHIGDDLSIVLSTGSKWCTTVSLAIEAQHPVATTQPTNGLFTALVEVVKEGANSATDSVTLQSTLPAVTSGATSVTPILVTSLNPGRYTVRAYISLSSGSALDVPNVRLNVAAVRTVE